MNLLTPNNQEERQSLFPALLVALALGRTSRTIYTLMPTNLRNVILTEIKEYYKA
jgi:hypothetical protein